MVVEEIVHQALHLGGGDLDPVHVGALVLGQRAAKAVFQELGEGEHRAERGAELVADHAEEARDPSVVGLQALVVGRLLRAGAAPVRQACREPGRPRAQGAR
ncbi:hypothetical protein D3C86_1522000 [compost metagenome]